MFIVNQNGDTSINVDTIDMFVAVKAKQEDDNQYPLVVVISDNFEEPVGRYRSLEECRIAIDIISESINRNKPKIKAPSREVA